MKWFLICISLFACSPATIPFENYPVKGYVYNDAGGVVWDRSQIINNMNNLNQGLEIRGQLCASSCLMYLSLDNVCIYKGVKFYIHGLVDLTGNKNTDPKLLEYASNIYESHLPDKLAALWREKAKGKPDEYTEISGDYLVNNGWVNYCNS